MSVAICRKPFVHDGKQYLPGDEVPDWKSWPRPEHSLHVGLIVLRDEPKPDPTVTPRTRKPVKKV